MGERVQRNYMRCECGGVALVTPTSSSWEFDVICQCGRSSIISWAHASAPPTYVPTANGAKPMTKQEREQQLLREAVPQELKVSKFLPCELTNDEQRERAQQLVATLDQKDRIEADLKSVTADLKGRMLEAATKAGVLRSAVSTRREHREVVCTEYHHYREGQVYVVRDDLDLITEARPMTPKERQRALPGTVAPAASTTEAKDADKKPADKAEPVAADGKDKRPSRTKERSAATNA